MIWPIVILLSISICVAEQSPDQLARRYLPQGTTLESLRAFDPQTKTEKREPAAKMGRMKGGKTYLALVYNRASSDRSLTLRVVLDPEGRAVIRERLIPGTFLWVQDYVTTGFQVLDLNADGQDEIITISSQGASLGAYLNIFAIRGTEMEDLLTKPQGREIGGYRFDFMKKPQGDYSVMTYGKEGSSRQIYRWDGKRFKSQL
jgi:hypothetical protein